MQVRLVQLVTELRPHYLIRYLIRFLIRFLIRYLMRVSREVGK